MWKDTLSRVLFACEPGQTAKDAYNDNLIYNSLTRRRRTILSTFPASYHSCCDSSPSAYRPFFFCALRFLISTLFFSHLPQLQLPMRIHADFLPHHRSPTSTPNQHQPQNAGTTSSTNTLALLLTAAVISTTALVRISAMTMTTAVELHMDTAEETVAR